jgi:DNA-binding GntR family transcriptional regulator
MLPQIDRNNPIPIYQQLQEWMRRNILDGTWGENYQLQAEDDLAEALNINRGTLRNAIKALIDEGLLIRIHGKGTFVAAKMVEQPLAESLKTFSEGLLEQNIPFTTTVLQQRVIQPDEQTALMLASGDEPLLFLQRVRYVESKPIIFFSNYVVLKYCPGIERQDFSKRRLFEVMEEDYGLKIAWGRRYFEARIADAEVASALDLSEGAPVMFAKQLTCTDSDIPVELSDIWIRGDSFRLSATVIRGSSLRVLGGAPETVHSELKI